MNKERSNIISKSGYLFIATNLLLAVLNAAIGLISNSLAILSDATHSIIDSLSGLLIVISEKLANHKKFTEKRECIERATTIVIALIIIVTGIHIIVESVEEIIEPEEADYSPVTIAILIISILIKYILAKYLKNTGKKYDSKVLTASGAETMNDTWISIAVFVSAVIYLVFGIDIEAYISIFIALIIVKIGLEFIFPKLSSHHHHPLEQNPDHRIHHHK